NRRTGRRAQRRGQGGSEDELRRIGADRVDDGAVGGHVATHHAITLSERTLNDVDALHQAVTVGNAATARAIHAHRVHFVDIGERTELLGEVADFLDGGDVTIHR